MGRLAATLLSVALVTGAASAASAEPTTRDRESAHALMDDADQRVARRDYEGALKSYSAADEIMGVPTTGIEVGKTLALLGRLVEAREVAKRVAAMPKKSGEPAPFGEAREAAAKLEKALETRIPRVRVTIDGLPANAKVEVRLDGRATALGEERPVDPGEHVVVAKAEGYVRDERVVRAAQGQVVGVTIVLVSETTPKPRPPPPMSSAPRGFSPLVFVGFAFAAVGLGVGAGAGVASLSQASAAKEQCQDKKCPPSAADDINRSRTFANVSNVAFAVGAVGLGLGVVGLAISGEPGGAKVALAGRF